MRQPFDDVAIAGVHSRPRRISDPAPDPRFTGKHSVNSEQFVPWFTTDQVNIGTAQAAESANLKAIKLPV